MSESFHVFLSHNSQDKPIVRKLAQALKLYDLRVWLDEEQLVPGHPWQEGLETIIQTTQAAVVLIGESGLGPWEDPEMRACLSEFVKRKLPVIPVLLPGSPSTPKLPLFLQSFTWVDLRDGLTDLGLENLVWGITGVKQAKPAISAGGGLHPSLTAIGKPCNLPYSSLGSMFKGRGDFLAQIHADFRRERNQTKTKVICQAIHGWGGIGKSRAVVEYAWRYEAEYTALFFVDAKTPEDLQHELARLCDSLNIASLVTDEFMRTHAALCWLADPIHAGWLLILDNVDTEATAEEWLENLDGGHVLITSRIAKELRPDVLAYHLDVLDNNSAAAFLLECTDGGRIESSDDTKLAVELAHALGGLPLALELAADQIKSLNISLKQYLHKLQVSTIKVREAKLLLVGQGKAGKTTLRKKLQNPNADMPEPGDTTRGIEITRLDEKMPQTGEPLRINVWDFGGQDIQYYAHQFFLTGSSLYALVTNERIQDSVHLPYWLNIIEMLGKKSPVLLIQNKDGGHCQPLRDEAAIRARFGNVHNRVYQTDLSHAATESEFDELRREIVHQASLLPHVERDYLASFVELRGKLEAEADRQTHYLRWEAYLALMPELSEDLLRYYANALTFFGVCQYFPDDALLSQFVFLRPKWIIDALYALLLHPSLEAKRGHFCENDTFEIWQGVEYRGMHALLVRMMDEFELCYPVEGGNHTYILPQRLPSESKTYGWNEPGDTPVQYRYKFMPKGILARLICRLHERIEADPALGQRVWCDAVIFSLPDGKGRVFAREVYSENTIELRATGDKRAEMLNEVIRKMDDINCDAKYDNLQVDKLVPCPCVECVRAESPFFHKYETLQKLVEKGKATSLCEKSVEDVPIDEIFGKSGVKKPKSLFYHDLQQDNMRTDRLRIFISYSHAQREYFPIFKSDFIQYARLPGLDIEVFGDDEIPIGVAWDEFLQAKVGDCDVMVLLVSQEFMNSNYIQEKEFGPALERLKAGRAMLIAPIYFAPCLFQSAEELASLQFFKRHGDDFGEARLGNNFSYIDLVKFRQTDGLPIPNSNRQHYMMELMKKLEPELRKLSNKSMPYNHNFDLIPAQTG